MKLDPAGSISESASNCTEAELLPLLCDQIQKKQDELMRWVNAWHRIDLHILVFCAGDHPGRLAGSDVSYGREFPGAAAQKLRRRLGGEVSQKGARP